MRFNLNLASLATLSLLGVASAGTTVKRSVVIPSTLNALCKSWKTECAKEALTTGTGPDGFLFRCKMVSPTVATVTCVSKDFNDSSVPEAQLTDPVIGALGLKLAPKAAATSSSPSKLVSIVKSVSAVGPTTTKKRDATIKRTVKIPTGLSLAGLCKEFKATCTSKAASIAKSGALFRCKSVSETLRTATVTCVSKDFSNPKVPEQQLTDTVIAALKLTLA